MGYATLANADSESASKIRMRVANLVFLCPEWLPLRPRGKHEHRLAELQPSVGCAGDLIPKSVQKTAAVLGISETLKSLT